MISPNALAPLLVLFYVLSLPLSSKAAQTNITVDDQYGDEISKVVPTYSPSSDYKFGPACSDCLLMPNPNDAYDRTWHDSTRSPGNDPFTITVNFTGFAVYVYFILPKYVYNAALTTNVSFILDGDIVGTYKHNPGFHPNYIYNYVVYSNTSLDNTAHTLVINSLADVDQSVVLFDRIVYTTGNPSDPVTATSTWAPNTGAIPVQSANTTGVSNTLAEISASLNDASSTGSTQRSSPNSTSSSSQNAVIGSAVAGSIAFVGISAVVLLCLRRRRRKVVGGNSMTFFRKKRPRTMSHGTIGSEEGVISVQRTTAKSLPPGLSQTQSSAGATAPSSVDSKIKTSRPVVDPSGSDPFQRDEYDEKLERLVWPAAARVHSPIRSVRVAPNVWQMQSRRMTIRRNTAHNPALLNHIATLQAEVDRLRDHQSMSDAPPPSYNAT